MTANPFAALLAGVPRYDTDPYDYTSLIKTDDGDWLSRDEVLAALAAAVPADLAEARKVLEGVTPRPWRHGVRKDGSIWLSLGDPVSGPHYQGDLWAGEPDARFIAWCREGVPALLARIAAQEARIKGLEAKVAEVTSDRAYIIGANAGWEAAVEQGEATPAAAAMLAQLEAAEKRPSWDEYNALLSAGYEQKARAEAAETALAAMTKERDKALEWAKEQHACADSYAERLAASEARVAKLVALMPETLTALDATGCNVSLARDIRAAITEAGQ